MHANELGTRINNRLLDTINYRLSIDTIKYRLSNSSSFDKCDHRFIKLAKKKLTKFLINVRKFGLKIRCRYHKARKFGLKIII